MSATTPPAGPRARAQCPARAEAPQPQRASDPSPALLTIALVADRLTVSSRHVRRLIERGELPVHRIGRVVRISEDDLARYLAGTRHA
jgi:excisionase family DNA binding protein